MKLVIGIVSDDDASAVLSQLNKARFTATKLATSGGFLRAGNVTLLVGVEDGEVAEVIEIFRQYSSKRSQYTAAAVPFAGDGFVSSVPVEITAGGATIFVIDVEGFYKL